MTLHSKILRSVFLAAALGAGVFGCATAKDANADRPNMDTNTATPATTPAEIPAESPATAPESVAAPVAAPVTEEDEATPKIVVESPDIGPQSEPVFMVPMTMKEMETIDLYMTVRNVLQNRSVHEVDPDQLSKGAIDGMLKTLSPHDSYLTPEQMDVLRGNEKPKTGIGVIVSVEKDIGSIRIIEAIEGGGAHKAGLQADDQIIAINGETLTKNNFKTLYESIGGPADTTMSIRVRRDDQDLDFTITRAPFTIPSVSSKMIGDVSYVALRDFLHDDSPKKIRAALTHAAKHNPAGYIIDLRSNTGGLLEQAATLVDMFVDSTDPILTVRKRGGHISETFNATPGDMLNGKKLVVLINDGSASASEILAGALKDFGRATIIGTQSFGKGSVQSVLPLSVKFPDRKDGIKFTSALYHLPSGASIQGVGIMPDIFVEGIEDVFPEHERDLENTLDNPEGTTPPVQPKSTCAINDNVTPTTVIADARISSKTVDKALLCALEHVRGTPKQTTTTPFTPAPQPGV
ncbi:S41 family peptidase [Micavibrio aeruginosavorus]|uniref:Peptidase family protein n=1 Tax=Micavibrio aeruginosavorus (strain ARL-13) TaxID=856793 RepID=G2KQ57_MICAA|nr:S41 family peptidase [Micavibrio aeruginosavorus]AEP08599.1 peptidase family protein [Micavibrio aeruginosavorus ARL-13]